MMQCSLPSLFDMSITDPITCNDLGIDFKWEVISSVGCCNGLVCILLDRCKFILWNPTTKKFRNLPDVYKQIQGLGGDIGTYGFGFDELSDDYEVFGIANWANPRGYICMVYSLRSNSWKPVEETDHDSPFNVENRNVDMGKGIYVNGKLHWYNSKRGGIVSLDLNSYVCGVVELPSSTNGFFCCLREVGECLTAQFFQPKVYLLDVWLMKEYGVKESWNKVVIVPYCDVPCLWISPSLLAVAPNGEVLLIYGAKKIVIYNPKSNAFRNSQITGVDNKFILICVGIYTESLVSVSPDAQ